MQSQRTSSKAVMKMAHVRHRVAAFKPNRGLKISRLKTEIAELKKQIEGLKPTQPGNGNKSPGGENRNAPEGEWTQEKWAADAKRAITG